MYCASQMQMWTSFAMRSFGPNSKRSPERLNYIRPKTQSDGTSEKISPRQALLQQEVGGPQAHGKAAQRGRQRDAKAHLTPPFTFKALT